jgi:hypothetical protein
MEQSSNSSPEVYSCASPLGKLLLSVYGSIVLLLDLGRFLSFLILYTCGRTPWTGGQPVTRPLPTHRTIQTQNKRAQIFISRVDIEPRSPAFERAVWTLRRRESFVHAGNPISAVQPVTVPTELSRTFELILHVVYIHFSLQ